jgi:hypothetical protein
MRKILLLAGGILISTFVLIYLFFDTRLKQTHAVAKTIEYERRILPHSVVHILRIPAGSRFTVTPALSPQLNTVEEFAKKYRAIAIVNAGFFDPVNQQTTSIVFQQGKLIANPRDNQRLVNNPKLKPYMAQILNRTEWRRYICAQAIRYDITPHDRPLPAGCQLIDAVGGGPRLLPEINLVQEGFVDSSNGRDALASAQRNARTAIGITRDGGIILVMIAQKPDVPNNSGMSLQEVADLIKTLGARQAMNLDGGSSSSLYYQGQSFYGKIDSGGQFVKRPIKSVLLVQEKERYETRATATQLGVMRK